jgi:hypothetical protein
MVDLGEAVLDVVVAAAHGDMCVTSRAVGPAA